ncbi:hypothetical protein [Enterobacter ludwigii]|uniref:hypothetical protein n=1 Tax=Enterobacter ludwigii TaxID=299767 RepID=UPI0039753DC6
MMTDRTSIPATTQSGTRKRSTWTAGAVAFVVMLTLAGVQCACALLDELMR